MTSIATPASPIAKAYASSQSLAAPAARPGMDAGPSFADLLSRVAGTAGATGRAADAVATQAATGARSDLIDVVTAVAESQAALETLVSVRDKVVAAYDDIMRMPI